MQLLQRVQRKLQVIRRQQVIRTQRCTSRQWVGRSARREPLQCESQWSRRMSIDSRKRPEAKLGGLLTTVYAYRGRRRPPPGVTSLKLSRSRPSCCCPCATGAESRAWGDGRAATRLGPPNCGPRHQAGSLRRIDPALQHLHPGDVIGDWGGRHASLQTVVNDAPDLALHRSTRGDMQMSWMILLHSEPGGATRVHLRLRIAGVKLRRLAQAGGGMLDLLTVAGLAAGLRERVTVPNA